MKFTIMYYLCVNGTPMNYVDNAWEAPECCECEFEEVHTMHWEQASERWHILTRVYPTKEFTLLTKVVSYA